MTIPVGGAGTLAAILIKVRNDGVSGLLNGARRRFLDEVLNRIFFHKSDWWAERGMHAVPANPFSPIPDTRSLDDRIWKDPPELHGIEVNESAQREFLEACAEKYGSAYAEFPVSEAETTEPYEYYARNGTYETVDGEILYGMVLEHNPDRIVQVGAGYSTRVLAKALEDNNLDCTVEVFEPYRDEWLHEASPEQFSLTEDWADSAEASQFDQLEAGDILFIDSSHVLHIGNELYTLLFEIIPRLSEGVLVHFHDIFLPFQYPKEWIVERAWFLNEQYAVRSFLQSNDRVEVRWMGGYMHQNYPDELNAAFDSYDPERVGSDGEMHIPNSLWLEITSDN